MPRFLLVAIAATLCAATFNSANADHGPLPIPHFPNAVYFGPDGTIRNVIHDSDTGDVSLILGWSFDGNDPNSPWESSSPTVEKTGNDFNNTIGANATYHLFNGSTLKFDHSNAAQIAGTPLFLFGPKGINTNDASTLDVTDSYIRGVFADDQSNVTLTRTKVTGVIQMFSAGTMTLSGVTGYVGNNNLGPDAVIAADGVTTITDSSIADLRATGLATVQMSGGIITGGSVSNVGDSGTPYIGLNGVTVNGSLSASVGSLDMTGGTVEFGVAASKIGAISLNQGQVKGSAFASDFSALNISGTEIGGNLGADGDCRLNMNGGRVAGAVQSTDRAVVNLANVDLSSGPALSRLQAFGKSTMNVSGSGIVIGNVLAVDDSKLNLSVGDLLGEVVATDGATIEVKNTAVSGGLGALGEHSSIRMTGGNLGGGAQSQGSGTIELNSVATSGFMAAFNTSHLIFGPGTSAEHDLTAFQNAFVEVRGGTIAGNLVGTGQSITAMSGGHVVGFPVFSENAAFLYSGGTFDLFGFPPPPTGDELTALASGAGVEPLDSPLPGFTALDNAEIQFIGFGLQSTLLDPNFDGGNYSLYRLTGLLADGTSIDGGMVYIQNQTGARFELVEATLPEPSTLAILVNILFLICACRRGRLFLGVTKGGMSD